MPPGGPPPVYSACVKADFGKPSPFSVFGHVLGGFFQSPHSLLCPWAPSTWLWTTPCLAELPSELSTQGVRAGMLAWGLWKGKVRGAGKNVLGWFALPASMETACKSLCTAEGAQSWDEKGMRGWAVMWEGAGLGLGPVDGSSRQAAFSSG